jgi:hypothetical protein
MLQGKVRAALRLVEKDASPGVPNLSEEVLNDLKALHPEAKAAIDQVLLQAEIPYFDPVIYTNIDESSTIATAAPGSTKD